MDNDFVLLVEKEAMWAEMLQEVLKDNAVPCVAIPVFGAGLTLKTGMQERMRILVPREKKQIAERFLHELFPDEDNETDIRLK